MRHPERQSGYDFPLQTKLTLDELSELRSLARRDGWLLEDYATEILRGHLYVIRYLGDPVRH